MKTSANNLAFSVNRAMPGTLTGQVVNELRRRGKKVWWYVCCGPRCPYANFASLEYPFIEGGRTPVGPQT
ncbi:MAG: hypothetical protein K6G91_09005 [Kiritimatiellae bacterium]|nr:hypothetical protein [Kiritimatiellia bacterium]